MFGGKSCPACGLPWEQAIYLGFPLRVCFRHEGGAAIIAGAWAWVPMLFPFSSALMVYRGAYLPALWRWLTGLPDIDSEE